MNNNRNNFYFYSNRNVQWNGKQTIRKIAFAGVIIDNNLQIGISECSEKDVYDKRKGRIIAEGRAIKKPVYKYDLTFLDKTKKLSDLFVEQCQIFIKEEEMIKV